MPPNVKLLLAQMDCRTVCAALQEALGPSFYSTLSRLFCRHRLSLLAFGASRTVFISKSGEVDAQGLPACSFAGISATPYNM